MPAKTKARPEVNGRPTLYKGIRMRSRTEADFAAYLDRRGRQWEYEPDCYADAGGQWLPDFRVTFEDGHRRLIEVKPAQLLAPSGAECPNCVIRRVDSIIDRARIAWSSDRESTIEIVFWRYGATVPDLAIVGGAGCAGCRHQGNWLAKVPGLAFFFVWPGQGQKHELEDHPDPDAEDPSPGEADPAASVDLGALAGLASPDGEPGELS